MKKITVFEGTINGEKFDNVKAYNDKMAELINSGATDIQASSSTSIKTVDDTCNTAKCNDELNVSYHPYFEDTTDNHYLDELVTDNEKTNENNMDKMIRILDASFNHIIDGLENCSLSDKKDYLLEIQSIISGIKQDKKANEKCAETLKSNKDEADAKFAAAKKEYDETLDKIRHDMRIIKWAERFITNLLEFYNGVEGETIDAIKNHVELDKNKQHVDDKTKVKPTENIDIKTSIKEHTPQLVAGIESLLNEIFGDSVYYTNVKNIK